MKNTIRLLCFIRVQEGVEEEIASLKMGKIAQTSWVLSVMVFGKIMITATVHSVSRQQHKFMNESTDVMLLIKIKLLLSLELD